tara:strand:+ start:1057 stop:1266 length:210 start_codon:yes stop_codon:yes gene_type:complete
MSDKGKLKRGARYHKKLLLNKDLPKEKWLTLPKQVDEMHPEVLLYRSSLAKPKAEPKPKEVPKSKEEKK